MRNEDTDDSHLGDSSDAAMSLAVESKDTLELTMTKTCLDVFTKLGAVSQFYFSQRVTMNSFYSLVASQKEFKEKIQEIE